MNSKLTLIDRCREIENKFPLPPSDWHKCHQYYVAPKVMKKLKHAWTFGIGKDARHEGWIRHFNRNVIIQTYDPTHLSEQTIHNENWTIMHRDSNVGIEGKPKIKWFDWAYHPSSGSVNFYTLDAKKRCYSTLNYKPENVVHQYKVKSKNIKALLETQLIPDYIKFDLEGLWFEFIHDLLDNKLFVNQLVGEFEMYLGDENQLFERLNIIIQLMLDAGYIVYTNRKLHTEMIELAFVRKEFI